MGRFLLLSLVCCVLITGIASARTWFVLPDSTGDAPTIQAGIDSAGAGDTVLVACGTYHEYDICMKSGICLTGQTGTADCVTIDADGSARRVFSCFGLDSTTSIVGLTFANGEITSGSGGGMYCQNSHARFTNCSFSDNYSADFAGGAHLKNSSPVFAGCVFSGNYHHNEGMPAGGVYVQSGSPRFSDCVFSDNGSALCSGGGVVCAYSCRTTFEYCLFERNVGGMGGALVTTDESFAELANCTFSDNVDYTDKGGGVHCMMSSSASLDNCIIAFSLNGQGIWWDGTSTEPVLTCCDVYGNADGDWVGPFADQYGINGNISEDPLFYDRDSADYHLQWDSPCAPAQQPVCGLIGALGEAYYSGIPECEGPPVAKEPVLSVRPNPSGGGTDIAYEIPGGPGTLLPVLVQVYDAAGRHVRTLVDGYLPAGRHTADWDGLDTQGRTQAPGIYFCRMQAGDKVLAQKILLVR